MITEADNDNDDDVQNDGEEYDANDDGENNHDEHKSFERGRCEEVNRGT